MPLINIVWDNYMLDPSSFSAQLPMLSKWIIWTMIIPSSLSFGRGWKNTHKRKRLGIGTNICTPTPTQVNHIITCMHTYIEHNMSNCYQILKRASEGIAGIKRCRSLNWGHERYPMYESYGIKIHATYGFLLVSCIGHLMVPYCIQIHAQIHMIVAYVEIEDNKSTFRLCALKYLSISSTCTTWLMHSEGENVECVFDRQ